MYKRLADDPSTHITLVNVIQAITLATLVYSLNLRIDHIFTYPEFLLSLASLFIIIIVWIRFLVMTPYERPFSGIGHTLYFFLGVAENIAMYNYSKPVIWAISVGFIAAFAAITHLNFLANAKIIQFSGDGDKLVKYKKQEKEALYLWMIPLALFMWIFAWVLSQRPNQTTLFQIIAFVIITLLWLRTLMISRESRL